MNVLILGGTGLISTAISQQLIDAGHTLTLYNRGDTQSRLSGDYRHIQGDRNDFTAFEAQMADAGTFDCVIDMICFTPNQAESDIRAFDGRVGQLIFCSTVDVYSKPPNAFPITESQERQPLSDYGRDKAKCEDIFLAADKLGKLPVTVIRPASTYGEGGHIIHTFGWDTFFLDRLRKGMPIIVHGDGEALWASCYIADIARAFVNAIGNKKALGNVYHVTGEEWQTWNQYHQRLAEAIGAPQPEIVHIPADLLVQMAPKETMVTFQNFQYTNIFDNSAAKKDLDFCYTIDWKLGVKRTYDWLVEHDLIKSWESNLFYDLVIEHFNNLSCEMIANIEFPGLR